MNFIIMTFSYKAIEYFCSLKTPDLNIPGVELINPYINDNVKEIVYKFFLKFYKDENERLFIAGINPGRFGGGLTGICFTDPVALREQCGIENNLGVRKELSSKFIYEMIAAYGGVNKFYSKVFLSALYPFTIVKNNKNFNYYDDKNLFDLLKQEIVKSVRAQIEFGAKRGFVIILGKKNADYFSVLNKEHNFFKKIIVLEHPRYIMQYQLKQTVKYINKYLKAVNN
jgi:hypothetical protein